jgi:hypothetical protein
MQNPRQQNELHSTGSKDRSSRVSCQPRPKYRLEALIALQKALENGIPEREAQRNEQDAIDRQAEPIIEPKEPVFQERLLRSMLSKMRGLISAALQRRRSCARVRNNVVGLP